MQPSVYQQSQAAEQHNMPFEHTSKQKHKYKLKYKYESLKCMCAQAQCLLSPWWSSEATKVVHVLEIYQDTNTNTNTTNKQKCAAAL